MPIRPSDPLLYGPPESSMLSRFVDSLGIYAWIAFFLMGIVITIGVIVAVYKTFVSSPKKKV